jgi:hypothetical protein
VNSRSAGASWWLDGVDLEAVTVDKVHGVLRAGPLR